MTYAGLAGRVCRIGVAGGRGREIATLVCINSFVCFNINPQ